MYESVEWWNRRKDGIGEVSERILEERIGVLEECAYYSRSTNMFILLIYIYIYIYIYIILILR
jgi:hypothetical protein